ncbi:MAG: zinc ribbon domain-containing protein [Bryobacteraceae bacterium]
MPIFEYRCDGCGTKFEKLVRRSEDATLCPSCGDTHVTTQYSTFAARANGVAKEPSMGGCPPGMCQNPGFCGRN